MAKAVAGRLELPAGHDRDFERLTGHFVDYCVADPEAPTFAAVADLGWHLLTGSPSGTEHRH